MLLPLIYHTVKPLLKIGFLVVFVLLLVSVTAAYQLTLAWDANTESDLEGYILYGREWSPCPPYDYIATYPVTELADPLNPRCKVTDLEKDVIYFFVQGRYHCLGQLLGRKTLQPCDSEVPETDVEGIGHSRIDRQQDQ